MYIAQTHETIQCTVSRIMPELFVYTARDTLGNSHE